MKAYCFRHNFGFPEHSKKPQLQPLGGPVVLAFFDFSFIVGFQLKAEPTLADAILDRLAHQAHRVELRKESMRKQLKKTTKQTES